MKPGTYILTRNVENPKPDRRQRHDWRAKVTWEAGVKFAVAEYQPPVGKTSALLMRPARGGGSAVYAHENSFKVLAEALSPVEETVVDWLRRESVNPPLEALSILGKLAERGKISLVDVQEISKELEAEDF
jgi:hypothetical protein